MKNTKNLLITGIALAIALFASVQVTAMEPIRRENPHLSNANRQLLRDRVRFMEHQYNAWSDPKTPMNYPEARIRMKRQLEANKAMLYGNQPYTEQDIRATDRMINE